MTAGCSGSGCNMVLVLLGEGVGGGDLSECGLGACAVRLGVLVLDRRVFNIVLVLEGEGVGGGGFSYCADIM